MELTQVNDPPVFGPDVQVVAEQPDSRTRTPNLDLQRVYDAEQAIRDYLGECLTSATKFEKKFVEYLYLFTT